MRSHDGQVHCRFEIAPARFDSGFTSPALCPAHRLKGLHSMNMQCLPERPRPLHDEIAREGSIHIHAASARQAETSLLSTAGDGFTAAATTTALSPIFPGGLTTAEVQ